VAVRTAIVNVRKLFGRIFKRYPPVFCYLNNRKLLYNSIENPTHIRSGWILLAPGGVNPEPADWGAVALYL